MTEAALISRRILGMRVDRTSYDEAVERVLVWGRQGQSRYVCVATVNNVMESHDSLLFRALMNRADLVSPDGMPLVWGLKLLGARGATRVYGPNLTLALLKAAESEKLPVGFYGASPGALARLTSAVRKCHPALAIAYTFSPPFRPLSRAEDDRVVQAITDSGARILFVGLSTPKQEHWMAAHRGRISAVMLGVGAAFDFISGTKRQAPGWMQNHGLEWLFRLGSEPRRLWRRYLKQNPRFAALFAAQLLRTRLNFRAR